MKQRIKSLQKIGQARKYIYNSKKQKKSKQVSKQKNAQGEWHNMPENTEIK